MNALEEWGWLPPSDWLKLTLEEKALLAEIQTHIGKKRKEIMNK